MRRRTKKKLFIVFMILIIFLTVFIVGEIFFRIVIGKRLIAKVEENGLVHFKPNQNGWYHHQLQIPNSRINNIGARGEDIDLTNKKYIFLGDSFTFGWLLNDEETIPYYFMKENNLDNNKVINYACGGNGINHMIESYKFYNKFFTKEDTIIMIMIKDNFYRPLLPYEKSFKKEIFWKIREKSSFISWIWAYYRYKSNLSGKKETRQDKNIFKEDSKKLLDFRNLVEKNNQKLIYIFYEYNQTDYSNKAKVFCEENNLLCITDVYESVNTARRNKKEIFTIDNAHPSPELNKEVAKQIITFINR